MEQPIAVLSSMKGQQPESVRATYQLPHSCGPNLPSKHCVVLASDVSIHDLRAVFAGRDAEQIVWPDAWQLTQQVDVDVQKMMGESSAENAQWQNGQIALELLNAAPVVTAAEPPQNLDQASQDMFCILDVESDLIEGLAALDTQLPDNSAEPPTDAPDCLPQLVALYEEIDTAILVVRDARGLDRIDWSAVRSHFSQFTTLLLTTAKQFNLLAHTQLAVALGIGRYRHQWGLDLTSALIVPTRNYIVNAAQTIVEIYTQALPCGVMISAEADLGMLIHDIQNLLLKAQFQYELLNMMFDISEQAAPRLHADRTLPLRKRIDALVVHLREWIALYTALLDADS